MNGCEHSGCGNSREEEFVFIDPRYLNCVLAGANAHDIAGLRDWCASLPHSAYGRVFIEADAPEHICDLPTPPNVGVTWLIAQRADPAALGDEPQHQPGTGLARAIDAWLDEWMRADPLSGRHFSLWTGARDLPEMRDFWDRIELEAADVWAAAVERRLAQ